MEGVHSLSELWRFIAVFGRWRCRGIYLSLSRASVFSNQQSLSQNDDLSQMTNILHREHPHVQVRQT
jgi:hypothetical protein